MCEWTHLHAIYSLDMLALQEMWHENSDSISLRRAATLGYAVMEEVWLFATSKQPSERILNYGNVAIVHRSTYKSSKLSLLLRVQMFEFICCRLKLFYQRGHCRCLSLSMRINTDDDDIFAELVNFLIDLTICRCSVVLLGNFMFTWRKLERQMQMNYWKS